MLGDDVIVPTAGLPGIAKERMENQKDMTCHFWFFCTREIEKEKVLSTVLKRWADMLPERCDYRL